MSDPRGNSLKSSIYAQKKGIRTDSLVVLYQQYKDEKDAEDLVWACKELGKRYREQSDFHKAIHYHQEGLRAAQQRKDTLEMVVALNNIGTNFRRMGAYDEASTNHYQALKLAEKRNLPQDSATLKNRVIALNGIGNIYLTLKELDKAEEILRQALLIEQSLESDLGQAINYANLGAIFEERHQYDSAMTYYIHSMQHNQRAHSNLGVALCYTHYGNIYEAQKLYDKAYQEYLNAYYLLQNNDDRWHWLEATISLGRILIQRRNLPEAQAYLRQAQTEAEQMQSLEHQGIIQHLWSDFYQAEGNYKQALSALTRSQQLQDSLQNESRLNHLMNKRIQYEQDKHAEETALLSRENALQRKENRLMLISALCLSCFFIILCCFLLYWGRLRKKNTEILQKLERIRSNFFTNITHEFRTPISIIIGLQEPLRNPDLSEKERLLYLDVIARQGNNLLELVNQLLDVSTTRSDIEEPEWRRGNAVAFTSMLVESFRLYAESMDITLRFEADNPSLEFDFVPSYFTKIIRNLINNALKFSSENTTIRIRLQVADGQLLLQVIDQGAGIPAKDLNHIFELFYQSSTTHTQVGSGIGLALVQQLARVMDGSISVQSKEQEGSTFTLRLPLKHGTSEYPLWVAPKMPEPSAKQETCTAEEKRTAEDTVEKTDEEEITENVTKNTLLLVEDNEDVSLYIQALLGTDYTILHASNGAQGLAKAELYMPDMIITDLMMPEMDGYELCSHIRGSALLNHIPIIIISAKSEDSDRLKGLSVGADAYLLKPFNTDELHILIQRLLDNRRILKEKYGQSVREKSRFVLPKEEESLSVPLASSTSFLNRIIHLMQANLANSSYTSTHLAQALCISVSQLNRKLNQLADMNCLTLFTQLRINKAKQLLSTTDQPIGEIASACGFDDVAYFSRKFKAEVGSTPSQYRQQKNQQS